MPRKAILPIMLAATLALAIAACGSPSKSSPGAASIAPGIRYADCMRSHGVPNFPDPNEGGGVQLSSGIMASPAFQSAQQACKGSLPGGAGGPSTATKQEKDLMLALTKCMRAHGVSGFPDPTSNPPANMAGFSDVEGTKGAFIAIPNTINPQSPAFLQAVVTCKAPAWLRSLAAPGAAR